MSRLELAQMIMRESIGDGTTTRVSPRRGVGPGRDLEPDPGRLDHPPHGVLYQPPSLQTWRAVVSSIVPVQDFREQRIDRLGGYVPPARRERRVLNTRPSRLRATRRPTTR